MFHLLLPDFQKISKKVMKNWFLSDIKALYIFLREICSLCIDEQSVTGK
jgi:hypothetical protein